MLVSPEALNNWNSHFAFMISNQLQLANHVDVWMFEVPGCCQEGTFSKFSTNLLRKKRLDPKSVWQKNNAARFQVIEIERD